MRLNRFIALALSIALSTLTAPALAEEREWPGKEWETAQMSAIVDSARVNAGIDAMFAEPQPKDTSVSYALIIVHRGRIVAERYGAGATVSTRLPSYSMAKSYVSALIGILIEDGKLALEAPAPVPQWQQGDPRRGITLDNLIRMSDGLDSNNDLFDPEKSPTLDMLYGRGRGDVAAYAAELPLRDPPGKVWRYSNMSSNIVAGIAGKSIGGGETGYDQFVHERLLDPLGMKDTVLDYDEAGTFVGSSMMNATARDYARFGLLFLRGGVWLGQQIIPSSWIDYVRTPAPAAPNRIYGGMFWLNAGERPPFASAPRDTYWAGGVFGQFIIVVPSKDLVVVRLGHTPNGDTLLDPLSTIISAFPDKD